MPYDHNFLASACSGAISLTKQLALVAITQLLHPYEDESIFDEHIICHYAMVVASSAALGCALELISNQVPASQQRYTRAHVAATDMVAALTLIAHQSTSATIANLFITTVSSTLVITNTEQQDEQADEQPVEFSVHPG